MNVKQFTEGTALQIATYIINTCRMAGVNVGNLVLRIATRALWTLAGNMTDVEFTAMLFTARRPSKPCGAPGCQCHESQDMERKVAELMLEFRDGFIQNANTNGIVSSEPGDVPDHLQDATVVETHPDLDPYGR